jgi:F-type H+-transporting ATPase subunit delta
MGNKNNVKQLGEIYAQALFELAEQSQIIDAVKDELDFLTDVHTQSKDFVVVMASPYFVDEFKKDLLNKLFAGRLNDLTLNFLMVTAGHNRTMFLSQIIESYMELWEAHHGYIYVKTTVSKQMDSNEIQKLKDDISARLNSKTRLEVFVNPSIIGGCVIRYDSMVIDNTIKNRLQLAAKAITNRGKVNEI